MSPYHDWLNPGDNAWQLVAATLVGLMSIPGIAILYGGLVQKKWAVNTMLMAFTGFSLVLVVWVLWVFKMGFGEPMKLGPGILRAAVGVPHTILGSDNQNQAVIPLVDGLMPKFRFSETTLAYFQFVFAGITPLLFLGSVIGRINFKVWLLFVPLWSTFAYGVNAFLLWGGGWWSQMGALDYSGGYVIHLAAGTSGFVAAAVIGPRLARDRERAVPNNLPMAAAGAGILWLGWNGFNGGDMYFSGANASEAVVNTNLCTAVALLTWVIWPAAGFVNSFGAMVIGVIASTLVWLSWNKLGRTRLFKKVDDTLGVFHTHGVAGLAGGLLVGVLADPKIIVYLGNGKDVSDVSYGGWLYGHHPKLLLWQLGAAATVIVWDAFVTFVLLRFIGLFMKLRMDDAALESGDIAAHDEEAYPDESLIAAGVGAAPAPAAENGSSAPPSRPKWRERLSRKE